MSEIASRGQLRMSLLRVALVIVPLVMFLGILSGAIAGAADDNGWYASLAKPAFQPPGWAFPIAWTILYILIGLALALVVAARGADGRGVAIGLFVFQFALNLAWSPLFFAAHQVQDALLLVIAMLIAAIVATLAMARVRRRAAALMLPYLAWLCFAAALNHAIETLNPDAETLAPGVARTQITL